MALRQHQEAELLRILESGAAVKCCLLCKYHPLYFSTLSDRTTACHTRLAQF